MSDFFVWIILVLIFWGLFHFIKSIIKGASSGVNSSNDTVSNDSSSGRSRSTGSTEDQMKTQTRVRQDVSTTDSGYSFGRFVVETKGTIPTGKEPTDLWIAVSILDTTDKEHTLPVFSNHDGYQESTTKAFMCYFNRGVQDPGMYFEDWVEWGQAPKEMIVLPRSGERKLTFVTRWLTKAALSQVSLGYLPKMPGLFKTSTRTISYTNPEIGYQDYKENSERAKYLMVELALDVAMSDGSLHDLEGNIIKNWIQKYVGDYEGEERESIKQKMNSTMRATHAGILSGKFNKETSIEELGDIGSTSDYYEALDLMIDVMTADEVAHKSELEAINHIGRKLGLDPEQIQKRKDIKLIDADKIQLDSSNIDQVLGIHKDWDKEQICKHLVDEFIKWNSRVQTMTNDEEKKHTQRMLDLIADARGKYCE